jgi:hypothetical protein
MPRLPVERDRTDRENISYQVQRTHTEAVRNTNSNYGYSNHILNAGHAYGIMTDTMDVIKTGRKGTQLNSLKK